MKPETLAKVPAVTLGFWIIKIIATTLGETGGDTVTMTMDPSFCCCRSVQARIRRNRSRISRHLAGFGLRT